MSKIKKIIAIFLTAILAVAGLAACGGGDDGRSIKLKISFFKAGFGDEWIKETAKAFEAIHTDVKVVLEGKYDMENINHDRLNLSNPKNLGDIISVGNPVYFAEYVRNNKLVDLTDLYSEEIEGGETMDDLVDSNFLDVVTISNKRYGVPWEGAVTGFVYNVKLFKSYGLEVPETMEEFFAVCEAIVEKSNGTVAPLVYAGSVGGYFQNLIYAWMANYEGVEGTKEFFALEDAEVFKKEGRKLAYEQVAKIVGNSKYVLSGSKGFDHLAAQREFILGNAAMTIGGTWIETEMKEYLASVPSFEMALFPTPSINPDNTDKNGDPARVVSSGNSNMLAITAQSTQQELAREFLKFMCTQDMLELYTKKTGGNARPFTCYNTDWSGMTTFAQSSIEIWQRADNIFPYSNSEKFKEGKIGFFPAQQGQPAIYIQNCSSLADALLRANNLWAEDYSLAVNVFK